MLKKTVPTSWIEVASQSIRRGSQETKRGRTGLGAGAGGGVDDLEVLERTPHS